MKKQVDAGSYTMSRGTTLAAGRLILPSTPQDTAPGARSPGGIMKGFLRILTGTACLVAITVSHQARADERCNIGAHSVESFAQEYFENPQARHVSPFRATETMLQNLCRDEEAFAQVIEIYLDERVADLYQRTDPDVWRVHPVWMRIVVEMLMLGHEEPARAFLDGVRADAESGDPGAMTAFAYLGRYQTESMHWREQFLSQLRNNPLSIGYFGLAEWIERDDHPLRDIAPDLRSEAESFAERASGAGFVPAHSMYLAGQAPAEFTPCETMRSFGGGGLFGLFDDPDADDTPTNQFIETFIGRPDGERIAREMMDWSRDVIRSDLERGEYHLLPPDTRAAANLARAYADIRSNCALSYEDAMVDFGIEDRGEAAIGMHYAVVAPGMRASWQIGLVYAFFVDQFYDSPDRHYAAARVLQMGGYLDRLERHNERVDDIVGMLSRDTIRAAQEIMAEYGYYTSAIDGIPGPNFRNGLRQWTEYCLTDFGSTPAKCARLGPALLEKDWALPFPGEVAQLP